MSYNVPILLVIFNRSEITEQVFNRIKEIKPKYLYIAADAPRDNIVGEKEKCEQTRKIVELIDWECDVKRNYADINMGADKRMATAIDWFFSNVEEGIIFEDDCLPGESFFSFCEQMLEKYRDNDKIMHISGDNFQFGKTKIETDYYYSYYAQTWGWATWRRAWQKFDWQINTWPDFLHANKINNIFKDKKQKKYWLKFLQAIYEKKYNFWDAKWMFAVWQNNGLAVIPRKNLISNIGYGNDATHTRVQSKLANVKCEKLTITNSPKDIIANTTADKVTFANYYETSLLNKLVYKLVHLLR